MSVTLAHACLAGFSQSSSHWSVEIKSGIAIPVGLFGKELPLQGQQRPPVYYGSEIPDGNPPESKPAMAAQPGPQVQASVSWSLDGESGLGFTTGLRLNRINEKQVEDATPRSRCYG